MALLGNQSVTQKASEPGRESLGMKSAAIVEVLLLCQGVVTEETMNKQDFSFLDIKPGPT